MEDRELLKLAAKAAGYQYEKFGGYVVINGVPRNWNPLADDGDAFRLAVKLRIVHSNPPGTMIGYIKAYGAVFDGETLMRKVFADELIGGDRYAATRRSIVRVAAEIGRYMK